LIKAAVIRFREDSLPMTLSSVTRQASIDLADATWGRKFGTILADPPWQFQNRTGKIAPEHGRLSRYATMALEDICMLPVGTIAAETSHLYLWVPNALLPDGLKVMEAWGFRYKSNLIWHKVRKDGQSDGRGVGFYSRNVTEILLFGIKGKNARTLSPGRSQINMIETRKREHSRKPDEQYAIIEACSAGPRIELFARGQRENWISWGNEAGPDYIPTWSTYRYAMAESILKSQIPPENSDHKALPSANVAS
jgi:N6-adenosine-specific RNA methylase IME4